MRIGCAKLALSNVLFFPPIPSLSLPLPTGSSSNQLAETGCCISKVWELGILDEQTDRDRLWPKGKVEASKIRLTYKGKLLEKSPTVGRRKVFTYRGYLERNIASNFGERILLAS